MTGCLCLIYDSGTDCTVVVAFVEAAGAIVGLSFWTEIKSPPSSAIVTLFCLFCLVVFASIEVSRSIA